MEQSTKIIGRAERIDFPEQGVKGVPARIDTGAKTSAVWASQIRRVEDELQFVLFDIDSPFYTGDVVHTKDFTQTVVASSNGAQQQRYVVKLLVRLGGKKVRATFTLANRSQQVYPVLIGRKSLSGKFVVNVKQGKPLSTGERKRSEELKSHLEE
jgi:hypothetical protein